MIPQIAPAHPICKSRIKEVLVLNVCIPYGGKEDQNRQDSSGATNDDPATF
jgi:hypothetical protein